MEKSPKGMQIREIREMHEDECQGMPQDPGRMPRMGNWEQWQGRDWYNFWGLGNVELESGKEGGREVIK